MAINKQKGFAKIFILIGMVLLVVVLALVMNQVQKVQENRSKAAEALLPLTPPIVGTKPYIFFKEIPKDAYNLGETFELTIGVNSMYEPVGGVDIVGTYDSSKLELLSVNQAPNMVFTSRSGGACSFGTTTTNIAGNFKFSCFSQNSITDSNVNGDLAKITFKTKAEGAAVVKFLCDKGSTVDSNITKAHTAVDILDCNTTNKSTVFFVKRMPTATPPPYVSCDLNSDGVTNAIDFSILKTNIGKTVVTGIKGDLNKDNVINSIDVTIIKECIANTPPYMIN
jgi:hypothetical protein